MGQENGFQKIRMVFKIPFCKKETRFLVNRKFKMINFSDIVEENGKTIYENNLTKTHNIPIWTMVEVKWDEYYGDGACQKIHARLWVVKHNRDCDGSHLYILGKDMIGYRSPLLYDSVTFGGFSEENLSVIKVTDDIKIGKDSLAW